MVMINTIRIENFKSIRHLEFEARRVNLFIGEPNTGKSNIIEALAFFSGWNAHSFREIIRFKTTADLFFDQKVSSGLKVDIGDWKFSLQFRDGQFHGTFFGPVKKDPGAGFSGLRGSDLVLGHQGSVIGTALKTSLRCYMFKPLESFPNATPGALNPPHGDNLVAVLYSNEELRQRVGSVIREKGFRLQLKPTDNELLIAKDVNDELYSYPWTCVSETLRRVVFYMAVLESNRECTLLLDEPETNTFPFYTKYLAERIALDETNQFFVTTHNPYMLSSIVEKTKVTDLAVFVARMDQFETKLDQIPVKRLSELLELDSDAFFNLDRLVRDDAAA